MFNKVTMLTILASFMLVSTAHAYNPPIGIPAPSFGIDEQAPASPAEWPGAQANNHYYIDNTHANATDTNNPNGYPNKPRKTVPAGSFSAGTYIEVNGGPYTSLTTPTFNCTAPAPCWFRGGNANTKTVLTGVGIYIADSQYLIIENFDLNGGNGGISVAGSNTHHISVRNSNIQNKPFPGNATSAVSIIPSRGAGGTVHDIVISNMYLAELGNWQSIPDQDYHGVMPSLWNRDTTFSNYNIWFLDSTCVHISGNCIQVNGGNWVDSYNYLHHIYVGRVTSHDNRQAALGIKQCRDIVVSENIIYNQREHGVQPGTGIVMQYGPDNVWVIHNEIYSSNFGIRQSDTGLGVQNHSAYFIGNTIHDIHPQNANYNINDAWRTGLAFSFWHGNMKRYVVDNTMYDVTSGINSIYSGPLTITGNLIAEIDPGETFIAASQAVNAGVAYADYNLMYDSDGDFKIFWAGAFYSLADFQSNSGACDNCAVGDPRFIDSNNKDLRLGSDSAGKSMNNDAIDVYDTFFQLYGLNIRRDPTGLARPVSGGSVGAYESIDAPGSGSEPLASPPSPPPLPNANVNVNS